MRAAAVQLQLDRRPRPQPRDRRPPDARGRRAPARELVVLPEKWPVLGTPEQTAAGAEPFDGPALRVGARDRARARHRPRRRLVRRARRGRRARLATPRCTSAPTARSQRDLPQDPHVRRRGRRARLQRVRARGAGRRDRRSRETAGGVELGLTHLLRPALPRALPDPRRARRARSLAVPAAFTLATTREHWEVLLRARAIEDQAFVVAANQVGEHAPGIRSGGRSMIVDPWGVVLAQAPDAETFVDRRARPRAPGRDPPHAARRWPTAGPRPTAGRGGRTR